jgi:4-oxalocrotonate tautomerase
MPYVNLQITRGATRAQQEAIVRGFTKVLVRVLGERPEHTSVVIQEIAEQDRGFAGTLTDDWRRRQGEPGS